MTNIQEEFDRKYNKNSQFIQFSGNEKLLGDNLVIDDLKQLKFLGISNLSQLKVLEIKDCPNLEVVECPLCEIKIVNCSQLKTIRNNNQNSKGDSIVIIKDDKSIDWPCVIAIATSFISLLVSICFAWTVYKKRKNNEESS